MNTFSYFFLGSFLCLIYLILGLYHGLVFLFFLCYNYDPRIHLIDVHFICLQLHPYHFNPTGVLHPITVIYELNYGETEMKQGMELFN